MTTLAAIQRHVGVSPDGLWGPQTARAIARALGMETFDRAAFLARYRNTNAPAIAPADMMAAASRLGVTTAHLKMLREVESGGRSFDDKGRPVILFEPHIFYRQTSGAHGRTSFSNPTWNRKLYPGSYDGRWKQMADAAERDEGAALESASWGLWQIMGFHWKPLGYDSPQDFAARMAASEAEHLEALVRFIEANDLAGKLRACTAGKPATCRAFAHAYNGPAYAKNSYHIRMAEALQ